MAVEGKGVGGEEGFTSPEPRDAVALTRPASVPIVILNAVER